MDCDIVVQGGGVKGIALAGAVYQLEKAGYRGKNFAGTSAGAMIASLLAAGYSADEIRTEIKNIDYKKCMGEDFIDKFGIVGKGISLFKTFGIYNCNYVEEFIATLLARKGKVVFGDLPKFVGNGQSKTRLYNLCLTATDLTTGRLLVLPDDLVDFGIDPSTYSIAKAVKASISFPLFYEPFQLKDKQGKLHYLVDGGMISAYPMFILDNGTSNLRRPAIGVRLKEGEFCPEGDCENKIKNFIDYLKSIVNAMVEFHDDTYTKQSKGDLERSIFVSSIVNGKEIKTMDFNLSYEAADSLFENGIKAADEFISGYNFYEWQSKFRLP